VLQIQDKKFELFLSNQEIQNAICELAKKLELEYTNREVVFLVVLNGAFMFAADLMKNYSNPCEISFIKVSSYKGMQSSGRVDEIIGLNTSIQGKHVVILEDIVDTGTTIDKVFALLNMEQPASIQIATLLYKPDAFIGKHKPEFVGFDIPNKFVVGYGLDYNEIGRNTQHIYQVVEA
jgi:hypoxanthine phosphoribosyltransferase